MTPNPYEPPKAKDAADAVPVPAATSPAGTFALACFALSVVSLWVVRGLDLTMVNSPALARSLAGTYVRLDALSTVARMVGGVAFLVCICQAAERANVQGRKGLDISPGWCVAWFFVPVASLFMPIRAMSGLAIAADPREREYAPGSVMAWWLMYLASVAVLFVGTKSSILHRDIGADLGANVLATALVTGSLVALWSAMRFIQRGQAYWAGRTRDTAGSSVTRKPRRRRAPRRSE